MFLDKIQRVYGFRCFVPSMVGRFGTLNLESVKVRLLKYRVFEGGGVVDGGGRGFGAPAHPSATIT